MKPISQMSYQELKREQKKAFKNGNKTLANVMYGHMNLRRMGDARNTQSRK